MHLWSIREATGSDYSLRLRQASCFVVSAKLDSFCGNAFLPAVSQPDFQRVPSLSLFATPPPTPPSPLSAVTNATVGRSIPDIVAKSYILFPPALLRQIQFGP